MTGAANWRAAAAPPAEAAEPSAEGAASAGATAVLDGAAPEGDTGTGNGTATGNGTTGVAEWQTLPALPEPMSAPTLNGNGHAATAEAQPNGHSNVLASAVGVSTRLARTLDTVTLPRVAAPVMQLCVFILVAGVAFGVVATVLMRILLAVVLGEVGGGDPVPMPDNWPR